MPVFHPTMPSMAIKLPNHADLAAKTAPPVYASATVPAPLSGTVGNDNGITPAAPPSAVQMQIKALLFEQALSFEADQQAQSDS